MQATTRTANEGAEVGGGAATRPAAEPAGIGELSLRRLDGPAMRLGNFAGKNVLLVFGSYSDPSFRAKVVGLEGMRKRTGRRAEVLVVYSAELFTGGEVRRNVEAGVEVAAHRTMEERMAAARRAVEELKLGGFSIVVEEMDGRVARAFGLEYPTPAGAVLVGRDGRVVDVQRHLDLYRLEEWVMDLPIRAVEGGGATSRPGG
jgi:hypothetical protein